MTDRSPSEAGPRIGLALGSGGARGWCHIGVLRGLEALGIRPAAVAGCSMGAIVGAAYAGGRLDALEEWALGLSMAGVLGYIDMRLSGGGIIEGAEISRLLHEIGLPERIEDLAIPFGTVATDLASGEEVWFTEGDLSTAVRGSLSIPGVFRPYPHEQRWLLDGALCNPVPVSLAARFGVDSVIAVDPNATGGRPMWEATPPQPPSQTVLARVAQIELLPEMLRNWFSASSDETGSHRRTPGYLDVVGTSIDIMQVKLLEQRLRADPPDAFLEADLKHIGILDLHRAAEAIEHGHAMVHGQSDALRALIPRTDC